MQKTGISPTSTSVLFRWLSCQYEKAMGVDPSIVTNMTTMFSSLSVSEKQAQPLVDHFCEWWANKGNLWVNCGQAIGLYIEHRRLAPTKLAHPRKKKEALVWASCRTMSMNLRNGLFRVLGGSEKFTGHSDFRKWLLYVDVCATGQETEHAPDVDVPWVLEVLDAAVAAGKLQYGAAVLVKAVCSPRFRDLVGSNHIALPVNLVEPSQIAIDYGERKTAKSQSLRTSNK